MSALDDHPPQAPHPFESPAHDAELSLGPGVLLRILFAFEGRISRSTFWLPGILVPVALLIAAGVISAMLDDSARPWLLGIGLVPATWISFAGQVKRLHDRGKSGWWIAGTFVPYAGMLWQLALLVECLILPGTPGPNPYGEAPSSSNLLGAGPGTAQGDLHPDLLDD